MDEMTRWTPEKLERLKVDLIAARARLIGEGTYPSLKALGARLDTSVHAIRRAVAELTAAGAIADDVRERHEREQRTRAGHALRDQLRVGREAKKAKLLVVLLDHASRGEYPSVRELAEEFGHEDLVRRLREELRSEGLYHLPPGGKTGERPHAGLDGTTEEVRAEIEARRLAILAAKIARGEEPYRPREDRR